MDAISAGHSNGTREKPYVTTRVKRIRRDFGELPPSFSARLVNDEDIGHWIATVDGPFGEILELEIRMPEKYPFEPPKISFLTKVTHSDVDSIGRVRLDILNKDWIPTLSIHQLLVLIRSSLFESKVNFGFLTKTGRMEESDTDRMATTHTEVIERKDTERTVGTTTERMKRVAILEPNGGHRNELIKNRRFKIAKTKSIYIQWAEMHDKPPPHCNARLVNGNIHHWVASIGVPAGTVCEGDFFELDIIFPKFYPRDPPEIRFRTKVFHISIHKVNDICTNMICIEWDQTRSVPKLLWSIRSLLIDYNQNRVKRAEIEALYGFHRLVRAEVLTLQAALDRKEIDALRQSMLLDAVEEEEDSENRRNIICKELSELEQYPVPQCSVRLVNDDIYHWIANIDGPTGSVYEHQVFELDISFPKEYPFEPPKVKFLSNISHSRIDKFFWDLDKEWTPAMAISHLLVSIRALLKNAELNSATRDAIENLDSEIKSLHIA